MTEQRRIRFLFPGLLACVVATLVAVGVMVWVPYQRTQSTIREIKRMGGTAGKEPVGPDWLRGWVGDERMRIFDKVVVVDLDGTQVTDAGLEHLKGLTSLQELYLVGTQVTAAGAENLKNAIGDDLEIIR